MPLNLDIFRSRSASRRPQRLLASFRRSEDAPDEAWGRLKATASRVSLIGRSRKFNMHLGKVEACGTGSKDQDNESGPGESGSDDTSLRTASTSDTSFAPNNRKSKEGRGSGDVPRRIEILVTVEEDRFISQSPYLTTVPMPIHAFPTRPQPTRDNPRMLHPLWLPAARSIRYDDKTVSLPVAPPRRSSVRRCVPAPIRAPRVQSSEIVPAFEPDSGEGEHKLYNSSMEAEDRQITASVDVEPEDKSVSIDDVPQAEDDGVDAERALLNEIAPDDLLTVGQAIAIHSEAASLQDQAYPTAVAEDASQGMLAGEDTATTTNLTNEPAALQRTVLGGHATPLAPPPTERPYAVEPAELPYAVEPATPTTPVTPTTPLSQQPTRPTFTVGRLPPHCLPSRTSSLPQHRIRRLPVVHPGIRARRNRNTFGIPPGGVVPGVIIADSMWIPEGGRPVSA